MAICPWIVRALRRRHPGSCAWVAICCGKRPAVRQASGTGRAAYGNHQDLGSGAAATGSASLPSVTRPFPARRGRHKPRWRWLPKGPGKSLLGGSLIRNTPRSTGPKACITAAADPAMNGFDTEVEQTRSLLQSARTRELIGAFLAGTNR